MADPQPSTEPHSIEEVLTDEERQRLDDARPRPEPPNPDEEEEQKW
jgi:hypothetical protein